MTNLKKKSTNTQVSSKNPTASQRIEALGKKIVEGNKNFVILANEIDNLKAVITGVVRRLNAIVEVSENGDSLSQKAITDFIVQEEVKQLEEKVNFLTESGALSRNDSAAVGPQTFFVGKEVNDEGIVVNPRIQIAYDSLQPDVKEKLTGLKVGEQTKLREQDPNLEITEIYEIKEINLNKDFEETESEETEVTAQDAPNTEE